MCCMSSGDWEIIIIRPYMMWWYFPTRDTIYVATLIGKTITIIFIAYTQQLIHIFLSHFENSGTCYSMWSETILWRTRIQYKLTVSIAGICGPAGRAIGCSVETHWFTRNWIYWIASNCKLNKNMKILQMSKWTTFQIIITEIHIHTNIGDFLPKHAGVSKLEWGRESLF